MDEPCFTLGGNVSVPVLKYTMRMPDKGVQNYVSDVLEDLGEAVDKYPDHWIPVAVLGVLDWIVLCGWWVYRNTGLFESDDPYKWVFDYGGFEIEPHFMLMFVNDPARSKYHRRLYNRGIEPKERGDVLPFLVQDVFGAFADSRGVDAEAFTPPGEVLEYITYAVFLWVLSEYGQAWIHAQDEALARAIDFGVAYQSRETKELYDHTLMTMTTRKHGSCKDCGNHLYCVDGALIPDFLEDGTEFEAWIHLCNNCLIRRGTFTDQLDPRVQAPKCPHILLNGRPGGCTAICPHSGVTKESVWETLQEKGRERVERYREDMRVLGGKNHRVLGGQTVDDAVKYFKDGS